MLRLCAIYKERLYFAWKLGRGIMKSFALLPILLLLVVHESKPLKYGRTVQDSQVDYWLAQLTIEGVNARVTDTRS